MDEEPFLITFRVHPSHSAGPTTFYDELRGLSFVLTEHRSPLAGAGYLLATETKTAQKRETDDDD